MKRAIVDAVGNYLFFVPLVTLMSGFGIPFITGGTMWDFNIWMSYALASVVIASVGGPIFGRFLTDFWYKLFHIEVAPPPEREIYDLIVGLNFPEGPSLVESTGPVRVLYVDLRDPDNMEPITPDDVVVTEYQNCRNEGDQAENIRKVWGDLFEEEEVKIDKHLGVLRSWRKEV